jgi:hypothetical protein
LEVVGTGRPAHTWSTPLSSESHDASLTSCGVGHCAALLCSYVLQWLDLIDLFLQELYRLNSLPPTSLLLIHLQAGLSALKTPQSLADNCCREDPLHLPAFRTLAEGLPFAKHVHSKLMCALSHTLMDEHNPPAALPNGYVYSQKALAEMAAANGGRITCPRTGFSCDLSELRRVYVS